VTTTLLAGSLVSTAFALGALGWPLLGGAHAAGESTPAAALAGDSEAARAARHALVDEVARRDPGMDEQTLTALRTVPRHLFMPDADLVEVYGNHAFPIGHGQTISQPTVVAIMTDALQLHGSERVLDVGTGSGYQAAVLAKLAREVYSIEIVAALAAQARARLAALGYANIHVKDGDGYRGWPEHAPFDRIVLTAAPPELPPALIEQLAEGGILVAPLGAADQHLYRWTKQGGELIRESLGAVRFVPMVTATPSR